MKQPRDYRRQRMIVAAAGLALLVLAQRETPTFGTISITMDPGHATKVDARLAPPLDAAAAVMAMAVARIVD